MYSSVPLKILNGFSGWLGSNVDNGIVGSNVKAKLRLRGRGSKFLEGPEQQEFGMAVGRPGLWMLKESRNFYIFLSRENLSWESE